MFVSEKKLRKVIKSIILEQNKTKCLTSGALFHQSIEDDKVSISVDIPFELNLEEKEAIELETLLHNAVELVLRPYFDGGKKRDNLRKMSNRVRNSGQEVISFDFHGTLVDVQRGGRVVPREEMINKLKDYYNKGSYIIIYTAAPERDRKMIEGQLKKFDIPYDHLELDKPEFDKMYDNRYIGPEDDWV